jgi:hypothetical protein
MSFIDQLGASLDRRLRELEREIASLQAARAALLGAGRSSRLSPRRQPTAARTASRRRNALGGSAEVAAPTAVVPSSPGTAERPVGASKLPVGAAAPPTGRPSGSAERGEANGGSATPTHRPASPDAGNGAGQRSEAPRERRRQRLSDSDLEAAVEALLRDAPDGLSAVTLSKRTGASYARVSTILERLARDGRARASGSRRTSLWQLISEEQLIAERAAELERLAARSG